ncbi:oxidoreductase [Planoprotostelium fungivorum]|uniref:Oxidoreductase n=1 Tax=Planoprotostelium fungivorum TaxID=1890364 RepID=A0A2P6N977_9EUKA|nr:oxidoreductase [Planoprotostelium fungivorum]
MSSSIRVALIGLSAGAATAWASIAHLPYLTNSDKYKIIALLNSSVAAAREAIQFYNLPPDTKAYGSPDDLAADADVQLVVCSVRVDRHFSTVMPSILAGKDVFMEWPLASNEQEARRMMEAAKEKKVKTMVGLQGRADAAANAVRGLIGRKEIGDVKSVEVFVPQGQFSQLPEGLEYFTDKRTGGNHLTILFAHLLDTILHIVGPIRDDFISRIYNTLGGVDIIDGSKVLRRVKKDTPDHVYLLGNLLHNDAPVTVIVRDGRKIEGNPGVTLRIHGSLKDIELTTPGNYLNFGYGRETKLKVIDAKGEDERDIDEGKEESLPVTARNTARQYEAFAQGGSYADFADAVQLHRMIEKIYTHTVV